MCNVVDTRLEWDMWLYSDVLGWILSYILWKHMLRLIFFFCVWMVWFSKKLGKEFYVLRNSRLMFMIYTLIPRPKCQSRCQGRALKVLTNKETFLALINCHNHFYFVGILFVFLTLLKLPKNLPCRWHARG